MGKFISLNNLSEFLTKCKTLFYTKPTGGVPKTDLASSVQSSLDLADSAVQAEPVGSVSPVVEPYDYATKAELSQLGQEVSVGDFIKQNQVDISLYPLRNFYITTGGNYSTSSSSKHIVIPVSAGEHIEVVANSVQKSNLAWLTSDETPTSGGTAPMLPNTELIILAAGETRILQVPDGALFMYVYRGPASNSYNWTPASVAKLVSKSQVEYNTPASSNLLNPAEMTEGYMTTGGTATNSASYFKTGYVPVIAGKLYTILCTKVSSTYYYRYVTFFDSNKAVISGGISSVGSSFTAPEGASYAVVSLYKSLSSKNIDAADYGIFGGVEPVWEPWYADEVIIPEVPIEKKQDNAAVSKKNVAAAIADAIDAIGGEKKLEVVVSGKTVTFKSGNYSNKCSLDRHAAAGFEYSSNHVFNFDDVSFNGVTTSGQNDDIAPAHVQNTTIGANHAQPTQIATIASHGKTNADIGTGWMKDGITFYIVRIVDSDNIEFLSENTGTATNHAFVALTAGTLTKGGESMTATAISASQLWPSASNKSQKILLDGETEISANGTYKCHFCDIVESYDMVNAASALANLIARAGSTDAPVYEGDPMMRIENIFRFYPDGSTVVIVNTVALQQMPLQDIMFSQAARIGTNGSVKYYVPNSLPVNGYDFRTPNLVSWSSSVPAINFTSTAWADQNCPPNRVIMLRDSGAFGFALGFLPFGVGKNLKEYSDNVFELRNNTGKVYPHGVTGSKVGTTFAEGMAYNAVMYRVYFGTQPSYRIAFYHVAFGGSVYAFVDYSASKTEQLTISDELNGKPITVVEGKNVVLLTDVYNGGFRVKADYVSGETCFLVVKVG